MSCARAAALSLAIGMLLVGCSASTPDVSGGSSPTPASSTSLAPSPTPSRSAQPPVAAPKGWKTLTHQSFTFAYPPVPGTIRGKADDENHRYSWTVTRTDRCDPRGNCRSYEIAAVNDGCPNAGSWPTFAHRWIERPDGHRLSTCAGDFSFEIVPMRIVTRSDGLRGVIYDANEWFPDDRGIEGARAAVLNFPAGTHKRYEAIAFYFEDPTSLDVIENVLRSVRLG